MIRGSLRADEAILGNEPIGLLIYILHKGSQKQDMA